MLEISEKDLLDRMMLDNPWWESGQTDSWYREMKERAYFPLLVKLATARSPKRAVVLMGPRRVGKTVLLFHLVQRLIDNDIKAQSILYISLDTPIYNGIFLEKLISIYKSNFHDKRERLSYVIFDEIQYLKDWAVHLKSLVDSHDNIKFIVSGSAAAALKMKSAESGAGRFTDLMLPPLTFFEYMEFIGYSKLINVSYDDEEDETIYSSDNIRELNRLFLEYVNYGGFPEIAVNEELRDEAHRFVRSDIVDKVLLRDLPSLYGIGDVQELNNLFLTLSYNTAQELTLESLSKSSSVAKNTIRRYLEYLEAAFLIKRIERVDRNSKRFQRATSFKVYLTNPSIRAALFGPVDEDDESMGAIAETAIFSQWFHAPEEQLIKYARWDNGEVDIVHLDPTTLKPEWVVEVKWSDAHFSRPSRLTSLREFVKIHDETIYDIAVTTKTKRGHMLVGGREAEFLPSSLYCYMVGRNTISSLVKLADDFYKMD